MNNQVHDSNAYPGTAQIACLLKSLAENNEYVTQIDQHILNLCIISL